MSGIGRVGGPLHDWNCGLRKIVMDRDMRVTGVFRAQSDNPEAPLGFDVNNPWKVRCEVINKQICRLTTVADGGSNLVRATGYYGTPTQRLVHILP